MSDEIITGKELDTMQARWRQELEAAQARTLAAYEVFIQPLRQKILTIGDAREMLRLRQPD